MNDQWKELKETIIELRDNDGTGTQQEVCKFPTNYMDILEKQMQASVVSRQAVLDIVDSYSESQSNVEDVTQDMISDIIALPPVNSQPEVIRCKDCKHWTNNIGNSELRDNYCNEEAHGFYYRCSGDDYCSFAEKRTDGCV